MDGLFVYRGWGHLLGDGRPIVSLLDQMNVLEGRVAALLALNTKLIEQNKRLQRERDEAWAETDRAVSEAEAAHTAVALVNALRDALTP